MESSSIGLLKVAKYLNEGVKLMKSIPSSKRLAKEGFQPFTNANIKKRMKSMH